MIGLQVTTSLGRPPAQLAKSFGSCGSSTALGPGGHRAQGLRTRLLSFLGSVLTVAWNSSRLGGFPVTAAGSQQKSWLAPRAGAMACSESGAKRLRGAWTLLHPGAPLVLGVIVLVLQSGGNYWPLTPTLQLPGVFLFPEGVGFF